MSGFKLLAIRPMDKIFTKVLKSNKLYVFSQKYWFESVDKTNSSKPTLNHNYNDEHGLYDISREDEDPKKHREPIRISISAIVGKNGSGKSSLLELLYAFCYVLAKQKNDLTKLFPGHNPSKKENNLPLPIQELLEGLRIEVFYELDEVVHRLIRTKKNILHYKFEKGKWIPSTFKDNQFFYNIVINYSVYGLNENVTPWLWALFHKNDGYTTPIVINPMRRHGVIDINLEYGLAQSRLLTNLLIFNDNKILEGRSVKEIELNFAPGALKTIGINEIERPFNAVVAYFRQFYKEDVVDYFCYLFQKVYGVELSDDEQGFIRQTCYDDNSSITSNTIGYSKSTGLNVQKQMPNKYFRYFIFKYCMRKVYKILMTYYPEEIEFREGEKIINGNPNKNYSDIIIDVDFLLPQINSRKTIIDKLKKDKSHKTLKLRQAINLLKEDTLKDKIFLLSEKDDTGFSVYTTSLAFKDFSDMINTVYTRKERKEKERIDFIPGAMVNPVLHIDKGGFAELSSGEQQFLHSIHSILYHLKNLDSIYSDTNRKVENIYGNINVIMDEIELYFHPDMQRVFIKELLNSIARIDLTELNSINFIFSTHSPFILSDIHSDNILFLERNDEGVSVSLNRDDAQNTFGANINEMLAKNFFMGNTIGEVAKEAIKEIVDFCQDLKKCSQLGLKRERKIYETLYKVKFHYVVNSIGDKVIQNILKNNLLQIESVLYGKNLIDLRIKHLKSELEILEKKGNNNA